jgi:predicted enzyme related to lactoylglutathione lyase
VQRGTLIGENPRVERVTGIGGVFFRARDPRALGAWYAENLGISLEDHGSALFTAEEGDQTVWSPFASDTDYFGRRDQQCMVNFRVRDLDAMRAQLREAGADVDDRVEDSEYGRFGWAADPEGNRFELWQPPAAAPG